MAVGAHTHTHRVLATLDPGEQRRELLQGKRILEERLGGRVHSLAYPVGRRDSFGEETKRLAREAGYAMEKNKEILIYSHEYHADYAKYQPGHILNFCIISKALSNGISILDFGVGATQHKYEWQCTPEVLWRILVPLTWKGHLALAYQKARWWLGALRNHTAKA